MRRLHRLRPRRHSRQRPPRSGIAGSTGGCTGDGARRGPVRGNRGSSPAAPTGQQAIPGGTLIPLAGFDLGHTDPHRNTSVAELSYMAHIFPGILQYNTTTWVDIAPDLANSWEVDSTGKVYTFKVREGVTYSDGSPVSA